jgi:hypothetical protein
MAIIIDNTNSNAMDQAVLAISQETPVVNLPTEGVSIDFCVCNYVCEYENDVFASLTDSTDYKNDKTSFLIGLTANSSILEITLVGPDDETVITDDTFGEYFSKGSFTNTDNQVNYVGFIANWNNILSIKGAGLYYFKFKETVFSQDYESESIKYKLHNYNEAQANKTIRFKFIQNGIIENGLDYTGLNWEVQIRIKAKLKYLGFTLEQDNYLTSSRTIRQIQDKKIRNFEIETYLIPSAVGNILETGVLANNILISNYDFFAYELLEDLAITITENSDFKGNYNTNNQGSFVFTAEERTQNSIKRNV